MNKQFGILTFAQNTVLKPGNLQSSDYKEEDLRQVDGGYSIFIESYEPDPSGSEKHYLIKLAAEAYPENWLASFHKSGKASWYVFKEHIDDIEGLSQTNTPKDEPKPADGGRRLSTPWGEYWSLNEISDKAPNFTWGEALHVQPNGSFRMPANPGVLTNIKRTAEVLQEIRSRYGKIITVNSWYRDPVTNRKIGGASASRHLQGDAVDFFVQGMTTQEVYRDLNPWWGSRGGLAYHPAFVHIDCRGYKARWNY